MPAAFKAVAIALRLVVPEFRSASIVGAISAALARARAVSTAVPAVLAAAESKTRFPSLLRRRAPPQVSGPELWPRPTLPSSWPRSFPPLVQRRKPTGLSDLGSEEGQQIAHPPRLPIASKGNLQSGSGDRLSRLQGGHVEFVQPSACSYSSGRRIVSRAYSR
jgi:hypothetical protein